MKDRTECNRKYHAKNKERISLQKKEYYQANRDAKLAYRKERYKNNKERINREARERQRATQAVKQAVRLHYGCLNPECQWFGEIPPFCLDFHHINPDDKSDTISHMQGYSLSRIVTEINKCTVLCAMCHRMATFGGLDCSAFPRCTVDDTGTPRTP